MCAQWPLPLVHAGAMSSQSAHRSTLLALTVLSTGRVYTGRPFGFASTASFATVYVYVATVVLIAGQRRSAISIFSIRVER